MLGTAQHRAAPAAGPGPRRAAAAAALLLLLAPCAAAAGAAAAANPPSAASVAPKTPYVVREQQGAPVADAFGAAAPTAPWLFLEPAQQRRAGGDDEPPRGPPPLVVMFPALGQTAEAVGLRRHAHVFASNGIAALIASAPGAPALAAPGGAARRAVARDALQRVAALGAEGAVDPGRVAYWGAEWGAAAAAEAALAAPQEQVSMLALLTPWLGGSRDSLWARLRAAGPVPAARALAAAAADAAAAALRLPPVATVPLAGPPGSWALLELGPEALAAHAAALSPDGEAAKGAPPPRVRAAALLELLFEPPPLPKLLPALTWHTAFYGAASDADAPLSAYVAASKTARYASFHVAKCGRYSLLSTAARDEFEAAVVDQSMLLAVLLADDFEHGGGLFTGDDEDGGDAANAAAACGGQGEGEGGGGSCSAGGNGEGGGAKIDLASRRIDLEADDEDEYADGLEDDAPPEAAAPPAGIDYEKIEARARRAVEAAFVSL
ncbi:hypothetical protein Rsub_05444 [Raphidocelis subcapitata]|uniref:Uncharacterized protein n=1 Tax=Raphidocelis subcapitata TaxID=307507 RepID=A0A2V0P6V6_9CHLO|nr:hypothetical protein Rsub_05444 [Raphidocelis subcapitata]|eukprot:GBF92825.1 hypothetical protein Rsub_05444 [Raphidocelis subcapitata]